MINRQNKQLAAKKLLQFKSKVKLKRENLPDGSYWLEQSLDDTSDWVQLANSGVFVEQLISDNNKLLGKVRLDGKEYTYAQAVDKFPLILGNNNLFPNKTVKSLGTRR
jgi:hypothetical protein